jgi:hypothetical protein
MDSKVSPGRAMPYPSTSCGFPAYSLGGLQPLFYPFGHPTPYTYARRPLWNEMFRFCNLYGRMARGGHGLPKVLLGPAMPYPSTP